MLVLPADRVIERPDMFAAAVRRAALRVKQVVEHLKPTARTEHLYHTKVYRPWGQSA